MKICTRLSCFKLFTILLTAILVFNTLTYSQLFFKLEANAIEELVFPDEPAVDPASKTDGYSAVLYDNNNGLPTSEANAITETFEGFLWIGSYSGLIRYDGNSFDRVDSTTGIASVVSLFTDSQNRLWIGTNDSGVAVMEHGQYRMYNKSDGLKSLSIRSIIEDNEGIIYLATTHGIAFIDKNMDLYNLDEPQINEEYIRDLKIGPDGVIYGVTINNSVFTLYNGELQNY